MTWREYHEATKHSVESLSRARHVLDWANMPDPFRHYEGVPVLDLPADPPAPEMPTSCLIGMEACSGAHFLGRVLREQGHDVKLIPAQFVKPFVKSNKNDFLDAEAIAEAVERQNMRFVPIKTDDQLDLQAMHRVRDRLVARRTSVINQLRAFLLERGMVFAKTPFKLKQAMPRSSRTQTRTLRHACVTSSACCGASGRIWSSRSLR